MLECSGISDTGFVNIARASVREIKSYLSRVLSKIDSRHLGAGGLEEDIRYILLTSDNTSNEDEQTRATHVDERAFSMHTQACDVEYVQQKDLLRQYGDHER